MLKLVRGNIFCWVGFSFVFQRLENNLFYFYVMYATDMRLSEERF